MARLIDGIDGPDDLKRLSPSDLPRVCEELRAEIVAVCATTGGHPGASLGAVELVVALHYVLDSPRDRLVFDAGHQVYAHKLLTGRRDRLRTIRTAGGLSGFPERQESPHDAFGVGHASTAVSASLGMAEARRHGAPAGQVAALVGDGALAGGVAFEGLNQAGWLRRDLLVVLNDNAPSLSLSAGALSEWLSRRLASRTYARWRETVKEVLSLLPRGPVAVDALRRAMTATKALFTPGAFFEGLGFQYVGPVDGHDVERLVATLRDLGDATGPILLHARTEKGKGHRPTEEGARTKGHPSPTRDAATGASPARRPAARTFTDALADALADEMARDARVVAVTAGMLDDGGLAAVLRRFPGRVHDVGIAEQHAVTFAAGLACEGARPVVVTSSTFLQRAYDQIIHDVALQRLPVTFAVDRAGLVGADGKTHQGVFDLAYLRAVPNLVVMAPSDELELARCLRTALEHPGPAALRFPRRACPCVDHEAVAPVELGRARVLRAGGARPDVLLAAAGAAAHAALQAAEALARDGVDAAVLDARFVKPLDEETLCALAAAARRVVTVEEHALAGGFGTACLEAFERRGLLADPLATRRLGIADAFVPHGDTDAQLAELGLDALGIVAAARALVGSAPARVRTEPARARGAA